MIAIIDYDIGNIHSVHKAFVHIGAEVTITRNPEVIVSADGVVLPGVGAFGDAMANLGRFGLLDSIRSTIDDGIPFLGICVGMQVLFDVSQEMGTHRGLSVLHGSVERFGAGLKVPQIGWNQVNPQKNHPLLAGVRDGAYLYFAHSYRVVPVDESIVVAATEYGSEYPSVVASGNVCGIQFHPEKSQRVGLRILGNFVTMVGGGAG